MDDPYRLTLTFRIPCCIKKPTAGHSDRRSVDNDRLHHDEHLVFHRHVDRRSTRLARSRHCTSFHRLRLMFTDIVKITYHHNSCNISIIIYYDT